MKDISHFFSDYQHLVGKYRQLRKLVLQLKRMDPAKNATVYEKLVSIIVSKESDQSHVEALYCQIQNSLQHMD